MRRETAMDTMPVRGDSMRKKMKMTEMGTEATNGSLNKPQQIIPAMNLQSIDSHKWTEVIGEKARHFRVTAKYVREDAVQLGRLVMLWHENAIKEETKKADKASKERIAALKANDEEAYKKLIDTEKNTRLVHLLRQTDTYLDKLKNLVNKQQTDYNQQMAMEATLKTDKSQLSPEELQAQIDMVMQDGSDSGAHDQSQDSADDLDYYNVAHRIKEKISEQPKMLVGGTLKDYQVGEIKFIGFKICLILILFNFNKS